VVWEPKSKTLKLGEDPQTSCLETPGQLTSPSCFGYGFSSAPRGTFLREEVPLPLSRQDLFLIPSPLLPQAPVLFYTGLWMYVLNGSVIILGISCVLYFSRSPTRTGTARVLSMVCLVLSTGLVRRPHLRHLCCRNAPVSGDKNRTLRRPCAQGADMGWPWVQISGGVHGPSGHVAMLRIWVLFPRALGHL
jgi:hypothetical protein